jgi:N-acetylglucosaminyldiphosphoundecaprenol N-acetyl-beta-D-mannosaminyltransferase
MLKKQFHNSGSILEHIPMQATPGRPSRLTETLWLQKNLKRSSRYLFLKFLNQPGILSADIGRKFMEQMISLFIVCFLVVPLHLFLLLRKGIWKKPIFITREITGQQGESLQIRYFNLSWKPARETALFYQVLAGKIGLAGRSIEDFSNLEPSPENSYVREMKPGIFSLWHLRNNSNIGHEGQKRTEWEYCFNKGLASDFLLILRAIPASIFNCRVKESTNFLNLFGITLANLTMIQAVTRIEEAVKNEQTEAIFFVNPDCLNKTVTDSTYRKILQKADQIFPDGIGLTIAAKIMGSPLEENVNGTDMLPFLCEMAAGNGYSLFLLGAKPGVAEIMAENLQSRFQVSIAGTHHGYFDHPKESDALVEKINQSGADIVLVAFGAPLQEKWISAHKQELKPHVLLGVGGLFDFFSGRTKRAPRWLREIGLEWGYRILQEPGRMWQRYVIGNPLFLIRVLLWKIKVTGRRQS